VRARARVSVCVCVYAAATVEGNETSPFPECFFYVVKILLLRAINNHIRHDMTRRDMTSVKMFKKYVTVTTC
jgi:hypothetical protein